MFKRSTLLAGVVALALGTSARADVFFTAVGTVHQNATGGTTGDVADVNKIQGTTLGGFNYANNTASNTTATIGDNVRVVAADVVTAFQRSSPLSSLLANFQNASNQPVQVVGVFAGSATVSVVSPPSFSVNFNSGQLLLFAVPTNTFVPSDPTTWGINNNPLAVFNMTQPPNTTPVTPGTPPPPFFPASDQINFAANTTAIGAVNSAAGQESQGQILFTDVKDPFLTITTPVPPGFTQTGQGLFLQNTETVVDAQPLSAAGLTALNLAAADAGLPNLGGPNTGFATSGTGTATDFVPGNPTGGQIGDFNSELGAAEVPGIFAVPTTSPGTPEIDPNSALGALALFASGLVVLTGRRRKA